MSFLRQRERTHKRDFSNEAYESLQNERNFSFEVTSRKKKTYEYGALMRVEDGH